MTKTAKPTIAKPTAAQRPRSREELLRASVDYDPPDGSERDWELLRVVLARKLNELAELPREHCREPQCRRTGRCVGLTMRCVRDAPPLPPKSPEQIADMMADLRKMLEAEMQRRGIGQ